MDTIRSRVRDVASQAGLLTGRGAVLAPLLGLLMGLMPGHLLGATTGGPKVLKTDVAAAQQTDDVYQPPPPRYEPPPNDEPRPSEDVGDPETEARPEPGYDEPRRSPDRDRKRDKGGSSNAAPVAIGAAVIGAAVIAQQLAKRKRECDEELQRVQGRPIDEARQALNPERFTIEVRERLPRPDEGDVAPGTVFRAKLDAVRDGKCVVRLVHSAAAPPPVEQVVDLPPVASPSPPAVTAQAAPQPQLQPKPQPKPQAKAQPKPKPPPVAKPVVAATPPCEPRLVATSVVGNSEAQARAALASHTIVATPMPSARPQGDVIEQRPPAPATLACDATIELIVSDGSLVIVPNVTQMPVASARTRIADADLVVDAFDQDSDATPGDVLTQQPVAGSEVPRRTSVRLAVAMGLVVPAVTGLSLIEAMQQLKPFRVSPARVDSEEPEDEVTWQQPLAGTRAAAGSEVTLRVSQGPFLPTWALWAVLAGALLLGTAAVAKALPHLIKASVRVDTDAESAVSTDASTEGPPIRIDAHLERGVSRARFPGATA